jgi:predicted GIY-YIG superfamily endonuclease
MMNEWQPEEYSNEEILSLDRLKRAVVNRVRKRALAMTEDGEEYTLGQEQTNLIIQEEWTRAKEAVRSSRAAKETMKKDWDAFVDSEVTKLVRAEKDDLSSMGVLEKSI